MEGLFVVIAIVISLLNYASKQQKEVPKGSHTKKRQNQWKRHIEKQLESTMEKVESLREEKPESVVYSEGIEFEDRKSSGSLNYIEQSRSLEGECNVHLEHRQSWKKSSKPKKTEPLVKAAETEENTFLNITEENLLRSIVMAEILGPPKAMKKRIR